jgi:hypothetical protein
MVPSIDMTFMFWEIPYLFIRTEYVEKLGADEIESTIIPEKKICQVFAN